MNKYFSLIIISFALLSCNQNVTESKKDILLKGEWRIKESEKPVKTFQNGVKFSSDGQVFHIDSQGHIVPPHNRIEFKVSADTLTLVDYKYTPEVLYEKGTTIYLINKVDKEELVLEELHPELGNTISYENLK